MRPASIMCLAAMMLVLGQAVLSAEEAPASPRNDAPAAPPAPPATVAPAPAHPPAASAPAAPAPPAIEPAAAPGAVAPPATTVAGPDPKVVAALQGMNNKLFNRYSKDAAAAVKSKTEEIVRKYQPLLVAADAKIAQLTANFPNADREGGDPETKRLLRDQAAAEILIVQLAREENQKSCDADLAAAVAEGKARGLRLKKVFDGHRRALAAGTLLTEDAMTEDYDAAMKPPPDATGKDGSGAQAADMALCTVLNPTLVAVDFEIGSGADKITARIPTHGHIQFKMKMGEQRLVAKTYPVAKGMPLSTLVMLEGTMLLVIWLDKSDRLSIYDRTSELLPGAAGSMAPRGAPGAPMEVKRGVIPPQKAPPQK